MPLAPLARAAHLEVGGVVDRRTHVRRLLVVGRRLLAVPALVARQPREELVLARDRLLLREHDSTRRRDRGASLARPGRRPSCAHV